MSETTRPNRQQLLKAARKLAELTQTQLADELNVTREVLSSWETRREIPDGAWLRIRELLTEEFDYLDSPECDFGVPYERWQELEQRRRSGEAVPTVEWPTGEPGSRTPIHLPHLTAADALVAQEAESIMAQLSRAEVGVALSMATADELAVEMMRRTRGGRGLPSGWVTSE